MDDISGDKRELAKQAKDTASAAVALSAIAVGSVSYTHLRAPRDRTRSRMPSSA